MQFKVLGQVTISNAGRTLVFSRSKVGQVLSLLIARSNSTVTVDTLINELWRENLPRSALTTLQTYVYLARKRFKAELGVAEPERVLVTRPPGYLMAVDEAAVDAEAFRRLINEGNRLLAEGQTESAGLRLNEALDLWRGPAFEDVPIGPVLEAHTTYLEELRLAAMSLRLDIRQRLGRYPELIPELRALVAANPLNEGFHAQLIHALYTGGRRAEALDAYRRLWHILDSELGVQPGPEVQLLHQQVLGHGSATPVRPPHPDRTRQRPDMVAAR